MLGDSVKELMDYTASTDCSDCVFFEKNFCCETCPCWWDITDEDIPRLNSVPVRNEEYTLDDAMSRIAKGVADAWEKLPDVFKASLEEADEEADTVNRPSHYQLPGLEVETIEIVQAVTETVADSWRAYCRGNELKYLIRAEKKNGLEDLKKARKYLDWEIERLEEEEENE